MFVFVTGDHFLTRFSFIFSFDTSSFHKYPVSVIYTTFSVFLHVFFHNLCMFREFNRSQFAFPTLLRPSEFQPISSVLSVVLHDFLVHSYSFRFPRFPDNWIQDSIINSSKAKKQVERDVQTVIELRNFRVHYGN